MNNERVSDLTVDELLTLLRGEMRVIVRDAVREAIENTPVQPKRSPLDLPKLDLEWPQGLELISREEYYGDDGR